MLCGSGSAVILYYSGFHIFYVSFSEFHMLHLAKF